nr:SURF1 family protein [Halomonas sabkhae]
MGNSRERCWAAGRWRRRLMLWFGLWGCLVVVGMLLGLWQWERAGDKRELLASFASAPSLVSPQQAPPEGARLTLKGEFLAGHTLFLDNRTHDGQLGVAALTPLRGVDGRLWLVERGFLATGPSRDTPRVDTPAGEVRVEGRWQSAGDSPPLFGPNREGLRLQRIELEAWPSLGRFAHAGWLHQTAGKGQLKVWWQPNVLPPSRHQAYALQWWGLAVAALVIMTLGARRLRADREVS